MLRNPLATPYTLGISSSACLGAALSIIYGFAIVNGVYGRILNAFIFSLLPVGVILLASSRRSMSPTTMVLCGIAISYIASACNTIMQYFADPNAVKDVVFWSVGDLNNSLLWQIPYVFVVTIIAFIVAMLLSRNLDILRMGDDTAKGLGINVGLVRAAAVLTACLVTATIVAFVGAIGFVCLLAPHISRYFVGNSMKYLIPASALVGMILLLVADVIAKTVIAPAMLPVGAITALFGGPLLIFLLVRQKGTASRGDPMELKVEGIRFSYPHKGDVLKDVGFEMSSSEFVGIIGPNGSGKTTLLKCINRILEPQQGSVLLDGTDIRRMRRNDIAKSIGYVPQSGGNELSSPTVYEVVMMGRKPHGSWQMNSDDEDIVWKAMEDMNVKDLATQGFDSLSSGQVQRVLMARALAQQATIMLLDEPTSNLDLRYQIEVMRTIEDLVRNRGVGACAIIHDMELTLKYCDKVILMQNGVITAAGSTEDVITPENIKDVYGVDVVIDHHYSRPHVIVL